MARSAALTERLVHIASAAELAGHGKKEPIYAAACASLGIGRSTLLRQLREVTVKPERKRRADAGTTNVTREEAVLLSAALMASLRKSATKRLLSVDDAVDMMRSNGEIRCDRVDSDTGEIFALSTSTIIRALRTYRLHPDQLLAPAPAVELRSLHPNHVWQIDASLCVLYYLKAANEQERGLQVMEYNRFYKNKPANIKSIESDRVWSYEVTDHNSASIFVNYVMGAESGMNLAESFIKAICQRPRDPLHGVPYILMMDMGSANTSGLFKNFARRLGVELLPHAVGNARATGQVENARNIIERSFEAGLRFQPVANLEELNARAQQWSRWYNATKIHSRHPASDLPAYGWVAKLAGSNGVLRMDTANVDPQFSEMVSATRFKKRSAAFYPPRSPSNPTPGQWYLRHVAFLGAQPPAVPGLKDIKFSEGDAAGTVFFSENATTTSKEQSMDEETKQKLAEAEAISRNPNLRRHRRYV